MSALYAIHPLESVLKATKRPAQKGCLPEVSKAEVPHSYLVSSSLLLVVIFLIKSPVRKLLPLIFWVLFRAGVGSVGWDVPGNAHTMKLYLLWC